MGFFMMRIFLFVGGMVFGFCLVAEKIRGKQMKPETGSVMVTFLLGFSKRKVKTIRV
jgi:hypothetical protein